MDQHQIKTENLPPDEILSVRLGNDSLESVNTFVESTLFMGDNIAFAVRPHIMRLPKDCHFIAGLDWIEGYDAWLHPKSRRMNVVVEGRQHVIAHMQTNVDSRGFMLLQHEEQLRTFGAYKTANPDWDVQSCSCMGKKRPENGRNATGFGLARPDLNQGIKALVGVNIF